MERLLYNAIGAALPIVENGKHFYYASYHLGAGHKIYSRSNYTCCSGTYFQDIAEYQNLIYFNDVDNNALCVNLYLPSQVTWTPADDSARPVKITQQTDYPEGETINFKLDMTAPFVFSLKFRVPAWSKNVSFKINGSAANVTVKPGHQKAIVCVPVTGEILRAHSHHLCRHRRRNDNGLVVKECPGIDP